MAFLSIKEHTGDGVTTDFLFDIPYIKEADVHGYVNDVENSITFVDPTTIRFASAPADGTAIQIKRLTDVLALRHEFPNPTYLKTGNVENDFDQQLFLHQEEDDETTRLDARIDDAVVAGGVRVQDEGIAEFVGTTLNFIGQGVTVTETPANTAQVEISDTSAIKENTDFDYLFGGEGSLTSLSAANLIIDSVFLGTNTGNVVDAASGRNVAVGKNAMLYIEGSTDDCTLVGYGAGEGHPTFGAGGLGRYTTGIGVGAAAHCKGTENIAIGHNAGNGANSGWAGEYNVMIGELALAGSSGSASRNVAVGARTLQLNTNGNDNVAIGDYAGTAFGATSSENVMLGADTFTGVTLANGNVALGYSAGPATGVTHSNKLFIDNTRRDDPLILGDFSARTLAFNATITFDAAQSIPIATTALGLETATTTVVINGAAAPTAGQILEAIDGTSAAWITPAGGGVFAEDLTNFSVIGGTGAGASASAGNKAGSFLGGYNAAEAATLVSRSVVLGQYACEFNIGTNSDVCVVGYKAGSGHTSGTAGLGAGFCAFGSEAGAHAKGAYNIFMGERAGFGLNSGWTGVENICIGHDAMTNIGGTPSYNVVLGTNAMKAPAGSCNYNVVVGESAGVVLFTCSDNTLLGPGSGRKLQLGDGNVCIGHDAGATGNTWSNRLYINNVESNTPLVYGEFDNDLVTINGDLNIATGHFHYTATVDNVAAVALDWTNGNIQTIAPTAALNPTYTTTDPTGPTKVFLKATNLGAAGTVTWPATFKWPAGTEPTWTAAGVDIMEFLFDGTDYHLVGYSLASA